MSPPPIFGFSGFGIDPTGFPFISLDAFEERDIVIAAGIEAHDEDVPASFRIFTYLSDRLKDFKINSATEAEFSNEAQKVHYRLTIVQKRPEFQKALENPDLHVIYDGHSRYGRGACFDQYAGKAPSEGEQWENGTGNDNGIFRLGYPFVPVDVEDFEHHKYTFRPLPGDADPPDRADRHPDARRGLSRIAMPAEHRDRVAAAARSADDRYWGYLSGGKPHFLLEAGWENGTQSFPFELRNTDLKCKTFCHFGCSSRLHYREIIRGDDFKAFKRDDPPTQRFAYFTTAPSNAACTPIWLHALLSYKEKNNFKSWFASLEAAKKKANNELRKLGQRYEIF